jgi:hypothetical protein
MFEEFTFEVEDAHRRYEMTVTVDGGDTFIYMSTQDDFEGEVVDDSCRVVEDERFIPESLAMMQRLSAWATFKPERMGYPWDQ